ncbi:MAG: agmatine deiminase family protein, partial [Bacteroidales bacterium]|nr:agmatine deiminase family protein [Bacteroidales bacterium]
MKHLFRIIFLCGLLIPFSTKAQEKKQADWRQLHYLSEEEMSLPVTNHLTFTETDPPEGDVRMVAEYEPMQSVLIRYPLGIPYSVIAEMAEDINVVTLVNSSSQANQVLALYEQNNVNTENCSFIITQTDSYWTRDYGPWFVFDGNKEPGIVDFPYDRPRPNDNNVPAAVAADLGINLFGMNLVHTGGNMMV